MAVFMTLKGKGALPQESSRGACGAIPPMRDRGSWNDKHWGPNDVQCHKAQSEIPRCTRDDPSSVAALLRRVDKRGEGANRGDCHSDPAGAGEESRSVPLFLVVIATWLPGHP